MIFLTIAHLSLYKITFVSPIGCMKVDIDLML
jgi:hypothetical protein